MIAERTPWLKIVQPMWGELEISRLYGADWD